MSSRHVLDPYRDSVTRFSTSVFFHESVSPKHLSIPLGLLRIFSKICGDIYSSRCTIGVVNTRGKWKKSSIIKVFIILFQHLWEVELTYRYIFTFKFTLRSQQPDNVPIVQICRRCCWYRWQIATGVVDTGGKFATCINNTSETGGKICRRCHWYRWQICRRCRWYRWCTLNISGNFRKNSKQPNGILWGWGETDSGKKPEAKKLLTLSPLNLTLAGFRW